MTDEAEAADRAADGLALETLVGELDRLRAETHHLRARVRELEGLADEDPLAPVLNRRAFLREMRRIMAFAERYHVEAALIYLDLDGFKAINDTYGHGVGDEVLLAVARLLNISVRESDIVGRLGGDEFAVVLAAGGLPAAQMKGAQFARAIARFDLAPLGAPEGRIGASWGAYGFEHGETAEGALARADAAMYEHKRRRRDTAA